MKPTPARPARAVREIDTMLNESIEILDISVGGMALADTSLAVGALTRLKLSIDGHGEYFVDVEVRWSQGGASGVTFVSPSQPAAQAIQKYVAELLELGAAV